MSFYKQIAISVAFTVQPAHDRYLDLAERGRDEGSPRLEGSHVVIGAIDG